MLNPALVDSALMAANGLYENKISKRLAKVMTYSTEKKNHIGITNLTKADIADEYGNYKIRNLYFIPPVVSYTRQIVGIVTMEDGMSLSHHFMRDDLEDNQVLFEKTMKIWSNSIKKYLQ